MHKVISCYYSFTQSRVTKKVKSMKIEFTRAEIERVILAHANTLIEGYSFNEIETRYSNIPTIVIAQKKEEEDAAQ